MCEIIPNPGMIRMYTSGWPKNQNRCWNRIGSPPPEGSKNALLKFRSRSNMVIAPANTGRERRSNVVVIRIDQIIRGMRSGIIDFGRMLKIVAIKLIDPTIDEIPAMCRERIVKSTDEG